MMQKYPEDAEMYANDPNFERHRTSIKWGIKTPRDCQKGAENDALKSFEVYRDALEAA
jgi:hypothetical protein